MEQLKIISKVMIVQRNLIYRLQIIIVEKDILYYYNYYCVFDKSENNLSAAKINQRYSTNNKYHKK